MKRNGVDTSDYENQSMINQNEMDLNRYLKTEAPSTNYPKNFAEYVANWQKDDSHAYSFHTLLFIYYTLGK